MRTLIPFVTLVNLLVALAARAAPAVDPGSPYRTNAAIDLPVTGLGVAFTLPALLEVQTAECLPDCDPSDINAFDRAVVGNYSPQAHTAADVTVAALLTLPLVLNAFDSGGDGWLDDTAVYLETLAIAAGTTQIVKLAVGRAAPFVYDPNVPEDVRFDDPDAPRSFFSGHTTMSFAAAAATSVTFWQRNPRSPWRWVVIAVGGALAATVGLLKIEAGYHYWTDVIAGAIVGTSIGVLVPVLHFR